MTDDTLTVGIDTVSDADQRQRDMKLIQNVLDVRISAISIAYETNNPALYVAAIACNDIEIIGFIEELIVGLQAEHNEFRVQLAGRNLPLHACVQKREAMLQLKARIEHFAEMLDVAQANVELIKSGEVCYPPALRPTDELMMNLAFLKDDIVEEPASV